jgi:predicted  nucleic acid-binding Zn-ribbon protein
MIKKETFIKNSNIFLRYLQREISENKKDMNQHIETFKNLKKQKTISKQNLERFQNKKVPLKAKIPLIGRPFKNKYITEYNNAINETKKYRTELQNLKKKILYIQSNISKLNKIGSKTKKNIEFFVFNFENLDKESHQELMKYINKIEFLKRKSAQENMFSEILDIAKTFNSY